MGQGIIGLPLEDRAELGNCLVQLSLLAQGVAEVVSGRDLIRRVPHRRAAVRPG